MGEGTGTPRAARDLQRREAFFNQLRRDVADQPQDGAARQERQSWLAGPVVTHDAS